MRCPPRSTRWRTRRSQPRATSGWSTRAMCWWRSGMAARRARAPLSSARSTPAKKSTCSWLPKMESMTVAVAIHTRLFARLREQAGIDAETVQVPERSTVEDVYAALRRAHPALESNLDAVRPAINQEFSDWDAVVGQGDEVAFIPPVSGGANTVPGVPANSRRRL